MEISLLVLGEIRWPQSRGPALSSNAGKLGKSLIFVQSIFLKPFYGFLVDHTQRPHSNPCGHVCLWGVVVSTLLSDHCQQILLALTNCCLKHISYTSVMKYLVVYVPGTQAF